MKIFKLKVSDTDCFDLSREEFEKQSRMMSPWFNHQTERERHFAVCPACNNTIQILHLYDESQVLHAKHNLGLSVGLQDRTILSHCPLYSKKQRLTIDSRRTAEDAVSMEIKERLIENFDRVVYFIKQSLGLRIPDWTLQKMLGNYLNTRGWLYSGASLINIPWIFLYQSRAQNMLTMGILNESIREAIKSHDEQITFNQYHNPQCLTGEAPELNLSFIHHKSSLVEHELTETITMNVVGKNQCVIYSEVITFDVEWFSALIQSKNEQYRNPNQIALARDILS